MILLTVLSYNGAAAEGQQFTFDELGGTIGRADSNQLVLADPERTISRVHAKVVFRSGRYAIVDNGSNPISVNGTPVGAGREQPLNPGDRVHIGGYVLEARQANTAAPKDPFADLFGEAAMGLAAPAAAPRPFAAPAAPGFSAPSPATARSAPAAPFSSASPLAAGRSAPPSPATTAGWPVPATTAGWPAPAPARPQGGLAPGQIPDDWDPFARDAAPAAAAPPVGGLSAFGNGGLLDLPPAPADSLDALFGLSQAPLTADPLGGSASQALHKPNMAGHADPLRALDAMATMVPPSFSDQASELRMPLTLPRSSVAPPAHPQSPAGAIFSWDNPPTDGRVVTLPGMKPGRAAPAPAAQAARSAPSAPSAPLAPTLARAQAGGSAPAFSSAPIPASAFSVTPTVTKVVPARPAPFTAVAPAPRAASAMPPAPAATTAGPVDDAALLQALLEGLDTPGLRLTELTPQTMHLMGQLFRESMRGTVELLVARAALKREMRADVTMIAARENNPLKFSPTVEVALGHLLGPPTRGFMTPQAAVRDAFDDLRAHQMGVMAGMRSALEGVLQRFDPQQLEGKLTRKSAISNLIPSSRKARLWELFQELFNQLQSEAQDDFDEIFGKAFLRAYEDQLERLQREPGPH